jgi:hypothetical protein
MPKWSWEAWLTVLLALTGVGYIVYRRVQWWLEDRREARRDKDRHD